MNDCSVDHGLPCVADTYETFVCSCETGFGWQDPTCARSKYASIVWYQIYIFTKCSIKQNSVSKKDFAGKYSLKMLMRFLSSVDNYSTPILKCKMLNRAHRLNIVSYFDKTFLSYKI